MSTGYLELADAIMEHGRDRSPRGMHTKELDDVLFVLRNPRRGHPVGIGREYGPAIAAAEALGLIGGVQDPQLMLSVSANFQRFVDGGVFHGSYGPRIRGQLPLVVQKLKQDPDTRQAVLQVWDARYDQAGWTPKDLPCTLTLAFAQYKGSLEMSVTMRSNDLWWGTAHDVPMFTALQLTVAHALGLRPGAYKHHAISLHIYERDFEAAEDLHPPTVAPFDREVGGGVYGGEGIELAMERARALMAGEVPSGAPLTAAESWYQKVLSKHIARAAESREAAKGK